MPLMPITSRAIGRNGTDRLPGCVAELPANPVVVMDQVARTVAEAL